MRVKLNRAINGSVGSFNAGEEADLPDGMARALIAAGHAGAVAAPAMETAAVAPPETTSHRGGKPRKSRRKG